jgi:hypothetical protein
MLHFPTLMDAFNERVRGRVQPARLVLSPENFDEFRRKTDGYVQFNGCDVVMDPREPNFRFEGEMVY